MGIGRLIPDPRSGVRLDAGGNRHRSLDARRSVLAPLGKNRAAYGTPVRGAGNLGSERLVLYPPRRPGPSDTRNENEMLKWALVFFVVALVAAALGFGGIATGASSIAIALFWIFLVVTVVLFLVGLVTGRRASL